MYICLINPPSTIDVHVRTLQLLRDNNILSGKAGIHFETGFINFNPYTTFNRLQENINFFVTQELPLLPYDMTSRLMVSGSCHMYSKILSDGLLKESQSSPMCDPYGYCFAESDIEIVYAMYVKYLNSLGIKNYANTLAKEKIYEKYFSSDYKSSLLSLYNQYIHLASNIVYFIMDAILTNLDDRYMECIVLPQINNSKEAIWEIGRKIELYDSIMSKKLYRINQLIF